MKTVLRHRAGVSALLSVTIATLSGFYINIFTGVFSDKDNKRDAVVTLLRKIGWWHLAAVVVVVMIFLQYRLNSYAEDRLRSGSDRLIDAILAAASRSIIYPNLNRHVRAIVTLRDADTGRRVTRYTYNAKSDPERVASYPLEFGVTGEAYRTRSTVVRELDVDHHTGYETELKDAVLPQIKTILAAPILASTLEQDPPVGVLAFDSTHDMKTIRFDRPEARELAQRWADVLAVILSVKEGGLWPSTLEG